MGGGGEIDWVGVAPADGDGQRRAMFADAGEDAVIAGGEAFERQVQFAERVLLQRVDAGLVKNEMRFERKDFGKDSVEGF